MKTDRRTFLQGLSALLATTALTKRVEAEVPPVEPEDNLDVNIMAPWEEPQGFLFTLKTHRGTLRFDSDLLDFPDDRPRGEFQFTGRNDWEPVRVLSGEVEKEVMSLHASQFDHPMCEIVTNIRGEVVIERRDGSTFVGRF